MQAGWRSLCFYSQGALILAAAAVARAGPVAVPTSAPRSLEVLSPSSEVFMHAAARRDLPDDLEHP